ncbi:GDP-mannose 4,6-dehydratase (plasmid) [Azospirillum oryzae]|uniref:GDP-mannose 4,6-dehydratase n=1 Tax=Azospirillum oryzae TaxID=286727 RepID=A0A6N1AL74_9PROT|nr:GDP-mannose 4,6-dehydratase [Azospirillum oryzae]KAA0586587.1 GDP-mannose 4,6-dehydratase [Azospirillum oryzae]QKS49032.1 GDP-mannose 4,6-dehydratase [Azospirillum oryzae]GLR82645.1 GDP-mannose 4,6-dehydratase [Azospirillum oryzae]
MSRGRTALIFGIGGQDGSWLADLLVRRGYAVHGTSRDREASSFANLRRLGLFGRVHLHSAGLNDFRSVAQVIKEVRPTEIYNLAGQSSVGLSFDQPVETLDSIVHGTVNILEAIRFLGIDTRFYNASSSECFGNTEHGPAGETHSFHPRSPYGVGKAAAYWAVANYREAYGLFACSGILFNHESPLRPARYVTQKIVRGAADIAEGRADQLCLGDLSVARDWGWAPEYVDAMARMLAHDQPEDFVIATGRLHTLEEFVRLVFDCFGLDWRRYVEIDPGLRRPADITHSVGDPGKANRLLGWSAETTMPGVVAKLVEAERIRRRDGSPAGNPAGSPAENLMSIPLAVPA